jgi:hypothetical protein
MSKQAKLAALIQRVQEYTNSVRFAGPPGQEVQQAFIEYANTPDDPPQPPEMPECVAKLIEATKYRSDELGLLGGIVRDHYAPSLKLEVGKVYEDAEGDKVEIVWQSPGKSRLRWLGVLLVTEGAEWYADDGTVCGVPKRSLIREVKQ